MNWFRENKFLGVFLIVLVLLVAGVGYFLMSARGEFDDAAAHFEQTSTELNRLERLTPFPSEPNFVKLKALADEYAGSVDALKRDLKARVLPVEQMAPNEFQALLRQVVTAVTDKARANKVELPANFYLGFDDFAASLPSTSATPLLGQQLKAVEAVMNILLDARIEALSSFRRTPLPEERGGAPVAAVKTPGAKPAAGAPVGKLVERHPIEFSFRSTPAASRKVLNQIVGAKQQFFIIRTLQIRNEKDKGPPREQPGDPAAAAAPGAVQPAAPAAPGTPGTPASALNFIVGTERLETFATIEMVKFNF